MIDQNTVNVARERGKYCGHGTGADPEILKGGTLQTSISGGHHSDSGVY